MSERLLPKQRPRPRVCAAGSSFHLENAFNRHVATPTYKSRSSTPHSQSPPSSFPTTSALINMGFCNFLKSLEIRNLFCCGGSYTLKRDRITRRTITKKTTKTTETTSGNNARIIITTTTKTTKKTRPADSDVQAREIRELLDDYRCRRWWPNMEWSKQLGKRNAGKQQARPETGWHGVAEARAEKNMVGQQMAVGEMEQTEVGDRQQEDRAAVERGERDWEDRDQEQAGLPARKNEERKRVGREESGGAEKTRTTRRRAYRVQKSVLRRAQKVKKRTAIPNSETEEPNGIRTPQPPGAYHDDDSPLPPRVEQKWFGPTIRPT